MDCDQSGSQLSVQYNSVLFWVLVVSLTLSLFASLGAGSMYLPKSFIEWSD